MNNDMLKQIIIDTIKGEEHLGENLKEQCVDYIEQLQNNWNELKKWLEKQLGKGFSENEIYIDVIYKMQELEGNNE